MGRADPIIWRLDMKPLFSDKETSVLLWLVLWLATLLHAGLTLCIMISNVKS
jgi:hypothetical protein